MILEFLREKAVTMLTLLAINKFSLTEYSPGCAGREQCLAQCLPHSLPEGKMQGGPFEGKSQTYPFPFKAELLPTEDSFWLGTPGSS